jgi:hypothetical protein
MIATPRPVIDADNAWRRWRRAIVPAYGSKQRVIANRKPETICEPCCRATTQCKSEMANQSVQACCPAGHGADYVITETLGENLSAAMVRTTDEASDGQAQFDLSTRTRQIGNHPRIATMNALGGRIPFWTLAISGLTMCDDDHHIASVTYRLHVQVSRNYIGKLKMASHGADSPSETTPVKSKHH